VAVKTGFKLISPRSFTINKTVWGVFIYPLGAHALSILTFALSFKAAARHPSFIKFLFFFLYWINMLLIRCDTFSFFEIELPQKDFIQKEGERMHAGDHFSSVAFIAIGIVAAKASKTLDFKVIFVLVGRGWNVGALAVLAVVELD
jgi:hypothetical protein